MGWRVFGQRFDTADLATPTYSQRFVMPYDSMVLAIRTWLIAFNDPVFTSLYAQIYSDRGGLPGVLLYTSSNVITKAQMMSLANAVREIYFEFQPQEGLQVRGNETYHFVLQANGYTGDQTSHLAWKKAFPDPVYPTGVPTSLEKLAVDPFCMTIEGAKPL